MKERRQAMIICKQDVIEAIRFFGGWYQEFVDADGRGQWRVTGLDEKMGEFFEGWMEEALLLDNHLRDMRDEEWQERMVGTRLHDIFHSLGVDYKFARDSDDTPYFIFMDGEGRVIEEYNRRHNALGWIRWKDKLQARTDAAEREWERKRHPWEDLRIVWAGIDRYVKPDDLIDWYNLKVERVYPDSHDLCAWEGCDRLISLQPGYKSKDFFFIEGEGNYCQECVAEHLAEEYIEHYVNNPDDILNNWIVDPEEHGWQMLDTDRFESGLHRGQNDDPKAVIKLFGPFNVPVIFTGSVGQFDISWSVWIPVWKKLALILLENDTSPAQILNFLARFEGDTADERLASWAISVLEEGDVTLPYDPGTEMAKVLRGERSDWVERREYTVRMDEETGDILLTDKDGNEKPLKEVMG
jgi:hypothetical protein